MKILMVGHGGREHALLRKLHRDAPDATFYITRGNGGTATLAQHLPLAATDAPALASWAQQQHIDLTVVGPEAALAEGIVDIFNRNGLPIFGPSRDATKIESSKAFTKRLLEKHGIPTASFATFNEVDEAEAYVREHGAPIVVKASGLAAGKGAVVCMSVDEALDAVRAMLGAHSFGAAGDTIVIEEFMEGEELSVFALCDGENALTLLPSQDHKRIGVGDTGPNTGGMGAYAPVALATDELMARVHSTIMEPTLAALKDADCAFTGLLYAGLMITADGPRVIEYNARFGDPETEALLPLMASSLLDPMLAIARGDSLAGTSLEWKPAAALTTVLAAANYPENPRIGDAIAIPPALNDRDDVFIDHAGTKLEDGNLVTAGGRVLMVTGIGPTLRDAAERSRAAADAIAFEGKQYRADIGWRELERSAGAP